MRVFVCLLLVSLSSVAAPLKYEVCDYAQGKLLCRDFDPRTDGRRAEMLLARRDPAPKLDPVTPPEKPHVEVISQTPALPPMTEPPPVSIPAPVSVPSSSGSSSVPFSKQMGPVIPVGK